jgi:hypothetical protein
MVAKSENNEHTRFTDADWNIDQALIWIATQRVDWVNRASGGPGWKGRALTWSELRSEAADLKGAHPRHAAVSDATWAAFRMTPRRAEEELLRRLRTGEIEARVDDRIIPAWWFNRAELVNVSGPDRMVFRRRRDERLVLASAGANSIESSWEVKEPRFEPETGPAAPGSAREKAETSAKRYSAAKATSAYQERVRLWPGGERHPSCKDDIKFMQTQFPGISRDQVRQLRRKHAPETWTQAGAPRGARGR